MATAAALLLLLLQDEPKFFDPAVHEATRTFTFEEFLIVPVRVHRLRSKESGALDCRLGDEDVRRIFGKANRIWKAPLEAYTPPPMEPARAEELQAFVDRRKAEGGVPTDY